jgi:hypothetical protein
VLCRPPSKQTKVYRRDKGLMIVYCKLCSTPIGVFLSHGEPDFELQQKMRDWLVGVATEVYPNQLWTIEDEGSYRHADGHEAWHIVPLGPYPPPEEKTNVF